MTHDQIAAVMWWVTLPLRWTCVAVCCLVSTVEGVICSFDTAAFERFMEREDYQIRYGWGRKKKDAAIVLPTKAKEPDDES